ncbi:hypothetical protein FPZ24_01960 [Sphingomonas panacisoli]|uniref:Uncharacterized protein n=1 Tax=Sphingomonas panacisoli TaxID=1813879 RepID=A0A5B8LEQ7_9SPHN|nr:hypothetical protein [Sphingomonas panacisoli]QDZ06389.1 hypothetical protein FPZ24_01960 [Sphingomonas panacisoli]
MTKLVPYDPNEKGGPKSGPEPTDKAEHHYHYYDHRTFVAGSRPPEIEEQESDEPEAILLQWQKWALGIIVIVAFIWASQFMTVTTVMNTVTEMNTATYTDDGPPSDDVIAAGATPAQCEGTYVFVAPKDGPAADYVTHSVQFGRGRLRIVRTDNSTEVQPYQLNELNVIAGDGTQYICASDGTAQENVVGVNGSPVTLDLRHVPQQDIWAYLKANGLLERYVLADSQREEPQGDTGGGTAAGQSEPENILVPAE